LRKCHVALVRAAISRVSINRSFLPSSRIIAESSDRFPIAIKLAIFDRHVMNYRSRSIPFSASILKPERERERNGLKVSLTVKASWRIEAGIAHFTRDVTSKPSSPPSPPPLPPPPASSSSSSSSHRRAAPRRAEPRWQRSFPQRGRARARATFQQLSKQRSLSVRRSHTDFNL